MDENNNIKIADFGLAAVTAPFGKNLTQQCGTPEFAAPEITTGGGVVCVCACACLYLSDRPLGQKPHAAVRHPRVCRP